ncbi:MAG: hypothetical protein VYE52_02345 [Bacteroidota bacterium]|nr:hypothetical protein [Bacteroidota bacterium]
MKKLIFFLFITLSLNVFSQSPSNFTYQSVARDGSGKLLSNKEISFRISVLKNSESGQVVFEEEHSVTTNINGLATLIVGKGSGNDDLGDIDWGDGSYFLKVEIDPEGGFNFIAEDTTQLLSVPYALYSSSSGSSLIITGQDYLSISNNEITVNQIDLSDDVVGILPIVNGGTGSSTAPMVGVITAADAASARNVLGLSTVASSGSYNDLTEKLTAGTNIDITNGVISSTDSSTTYTAGTGISIDGNNAISSTITQYTDADAQSAFTAGTNIDITNGVISSTDTDTVRSVTAGGNTLADGETLAFTAGSNVTITENAGAVTISSTDTNTEYTAGNGISIDVNNTISSTSTEYTAGEGIDINNGVISGEDATASNKGIASFSSDNFSVSSGAVTIKDSGIANDELAGSITDSKLNTITTANKVAGSSVQLASGSALTNNSGLDVTVDDSSIENNSGTLRVKADGISNSMIADPELKEFAAMTPASTGQYNFIAGTGDDFQALTVPETLTALGAGTMATQNKESVNIDGGEIELSALNIDGGTDINAAIADTDLIIIDDGANGTNRKAAVSRLKTYIGSSTSTSLNDLTDVLVEDNSVYIGNIPANTNAAGRNVAVGITALGAITTGDYNTALGHDALRLNTTGSYNSALGWRALYSNTTGENNVALGHDALYYNKGAQNTAIGNDALLWNKQAHGNTGVGYRALLYSETGDGNTALGWRAGDGITTGSNNTIIGYDADPSIWNASNQIVIGKGATGKGDNYAVIGNAEVTRVYAAQNAGATLYAGGLNLGGTAVSSTAAELNLLDGGTSVGSSITVANSDGIIMNDGGEMKTIPASDLITYVQSATSLNDLSDVLIDTYSYYIGNIPANRNSANYNYGIGHSALNALTTGDGNIAIGYETLKLNTTGGSNTAIGKEALESNTIATNNTAVGSRALQNNQTGIDNIAVGSDALISNATGSYNTAVGKMALKELDADGNFNTAIGHQAGDIITTGDNNIMIGHDANPHAQAGINQIVIGHDADGLGNNYAVIGDSDIERLYAAEDSGAVVYAGGINLSGGTTVSAVKFGTLTWSGKASGTGSTATFSISGISSSSIVTASIKSGGQNTHIRSVTPDTNQITFVLSGEPSDSAVIMYIVIN